MTLYDYAQAGYNKSESMRPPYVSSTFGMAYQAGLWCREHGVNLQEVRQSRGYTWIVNRTFSLNFKADSYNPAVTRI